MSNSEHNKTVSQTKPLSTSNSTSLTILCLKLMRDPICLPMDRPIDFNLRNISKLNEGDIRSKDSRTIFDSTLDKFTNKTGKDLLVGTVTGWVAGVTVVRVGKVAAFGLGGGIILLHFASECGYIHVNWERVREATKCSQDLVDRVVRFVKKNSCFSVGFAGGFFFGVAST